MDINSKPIIFLAFANDQEQSNRYLRKLNVEAESLDTLLKGAGDRFEIVTWQNATLDKILDIFQDANYKHRVAIFHFGGHANSYQLLFESREGQPAKVDAAGLAKFLAQQYGLQFVFLNGCETQGQVQVLLDAGVKAVVATGRKIDDDIAVTFAERFYKGLLSDQPLPQAFAEAEAAIRAELGTNFRSAYRAELDEEDFTPAERNNWPWRLFPTELPPEATTWSLSGLANDPYFGLPSPPRQRKLPQKPFRGLSYFTEKEAELFFGRGWQIRQLFQLITKTELSANPIILLYGQSGVGKSSLLAAGLLPRLKQVAEVRYIRREDAGNNLMAALYKALRKSPPSPPEGRILGPSPPSGGLGGNLLDLWHSQETDDRPLVIILDQVEELYTRPNGDSKKEMTEFLDALLTLFGDKVDPWPQSKLILGFRKEWLAEIRDRLTERELPYKEMFLKHLDKDGIIEAITGPAIAPRLKSQYDLQVSDELPIVIADDLLADRGSAIAPTLQIISTKLWENATGKPKVFDRDLYDNLRLHQANFLGQLLDQQLAELANAHPAESASGLTLDLLAYHTTEIGTTQQRNRKELEQAYSHLPSEIIKELLRSCTNRYLLVDPSGDVDQEAPDATRLTHDTLGPLVRARFDLSDEPGQRATRVLQNRVTGWRNGTKGAALDEEDLRTVEEGQSGMRVWDENEQRLIEASREVQAKRQRNRRVLWALGGIAVILITIFGLFAYFQWQSAQRSLAQEQLALAESRSRELASETTNAFTNHKDTDALLLAIEAGKKEDTLEAFQAIYAPLGRLARIQNTLQHEGEVDQAEWNRDESLILTRSGDGTARVWDGETGQEKFTLQHEDRVDQAEWNRDESLILTRSGDGTARVWDGATGQEKFTLQHEDRVYQAEWNRDESLILTRSGDGTARVWDGATGQEKFTLQHEGGVFQAVWNRDESLILTRSRDSTARVWDGATGQEKFTLQHEGEVFQAEWNRDESLILTRSWDGTARVWDGATGQAKFTLQHESGVDQAVWNRDESLILTSSWDGTARVWDGATGQAKFTLQHESGVFQAVWNRDESLILTSSWDGTARVWDGATGQAKFTLQHEGRVDQAVWNRDESLILTSSWDGTARVWDGATGQEKFTLQHEGEVFQAEWNRDESLILTRSGDGTARVWDGETGQEKFTLQHEGGVFQAVWNRDESLILTSSVDGTARVWETRIEDLLERACTRVPLNMTRDQWRQYMPDETYWPTCSKVQIPVGTLDEIIKEEVQRPAEQGDFKAAQLRLEDVEGWLEKNGQDYEADFDGWLEALEQGQNPFEVE